jgi:hypothetical protein
MSDGFRVSKDLVMPRDSISWVTTYIAKRGAGKTYDAAVYTEQVILNKVPTMVLDGMGVWWGLRTGVNEQGEPDPSKLGLPVVIIGGNHADIRLDPTKVDKIVEALLQTNTSAVMDISQFRKGDQLRIATIFAEELYRLADKYPAERVLVVEETDMFAPQRPFKEEARCLGAFEDLVKRGGNRNIGLVEITQRSGDFNKNLLTQSDMLVVGRTTAPQDKEAIKAWVEKHTEKNREELDEWLDSLSSLKKGEVWVWNDDEAWPIFKRVQFQKRITFHATRKFILTRKAADIKLMDAAEFIEKFRDKFEPKPKPPPEVKPKSELLRATETVERKIEQIRTSPQSTSLAPQTPSPLPRETLAEQTVPNWTLVKNRPNFTLPAEMLDDPPSPLARILAVLADHPDVRDDRWTGKKIKSLIRDHVWPEDGVDEAIQQLLRAETLRWQSGYLRFYRDRVHVVERAYEVQVQ